jgi:hypothetical protein
MNRKGYVLMGDSISSKKINQRSKFQEKLIEVCNVVNQTNGKDIIAPMKIIKGSDEIGGLLRNPAPLYSIVNRILQDLYPVKIRFVMVQGEIDTGLDTEDISLMDGPAFHQAAKLMADLKKEKLILNVHTSNKIVDTLLSNNINLIYLIKQHWSPAKREIIRSYEEGDDQSKVAQELGITQQTVSYHLKSSHWKEIKKMEANLNQVLQYLKVG